MDALNDEIHALAGHGFFHAALGKAQGALAERPHDGELHFARALVLFDWGRLHEALPALLAAEAAGIRRPALHLNIAWTSQLLGKPREAEVHVRTALALDPQLLPALACLAGLLQAQRRHMEAITAYENVLALAPERSDCLACISACHFEEGAYTKAESSARAAIALATDQPANWVTLGMALAQQDKLTEALDAMQRAGEIEAAAGNDIESFVSHAYWLLWSGKPAQAIQLCRSKLATQPNPNGQGQYAFALLAGGLYREGWAQYEFRWFQEPLLSKRLTTGHPVWAGQDLAGKTLLLRAEQGAGDTLQFARYARQFKALGAIVVLQVQEELRQLAIGFAGVDRVISLNDSPPEFDYYLHMMSAPHALGSELATIPADMPYLHVDAALTQQWAGRVAGPGVSIGFAWAGSPMHLRDRHRSMALDEVIGLSRIEHAHFVSLQKQLKGDEAAQLAHAGIPSLGVEFLDFADTAAAIANLHLVICVDTAIAHLAGALGKPVWLLVPEAADFRWLRDRDDSPWYPTLRLFRQRKLGEWGEVITCVAAALEAALKQGTFRDHWRPAPVPELRHVAVSPVGSPNIEVAGYPTGIAQVVEAREGIVQFVPDAGNAARSVALYGEYLQPQVDALKLLVQPGAVVLEAGSGIGLHTLALARMIGAEGHLFVYEDRPLYRRILQQNLDANHLSQRVTVMRRPLRGVHDGVEEHAPAATTQANATDTIDELLLNRLDLLKVTNAPVAAVLAGAADTLWRLRPRLLLAAPSAAAVSEIVTIATRYAYRCWRFQTPLFNPRNFNRRVDDVFPGSKALAVLAIPEEAGIQSFEMSGCTEVTMASVAVDVPFQGQDLSSEAPVPPDYTPAPLLTRLKKWFS